MTSTRLFIAAAAMLFSTVNLFAEENWTSFQNGGRLSFPLQKDFELDAETPLKWAVDLDGYGQSSPVKFGDLLYVTFVSGANKERLHVWAINFEAGEVVWKREAKNSTPEKNNNYISRAAPSPACDVDGVIAFFEGGNIIALSPTGELRWERDLVADYGKIKARHGLASSLEQTEDGVFVWVEREEEPYVLRLSKETGETVWKSEGLGVTTWSSPRLVPLSNNDQHLVLSGIGKLAGVDPESGERKWTFDQIANNSTPTPIPLGDGRFLLGSTEGRGGAGGGKAAGYNGVFAIQEKDGAFTADYVWKAKRATSSFGSPIVHQDVAYFVNRSGVVYGLDLETGKEQFAKRTLESVWATPLAIGGQLLLPGKEGTLTKAHLGESFEPKEVMNIFASTKEPGVLYAALVAEQAVVLRRGNKVYRY